MPRKKRSDMTPMERMEYIMTGASWDDGEDVRIEMLARCMALHVYARKEGEEYFWQLMERICKRADEWAHEPGNTTILAFAAAGYEMQKGGNRPEPETTNGKEQMTKDNERE